MAPRAKPRARIKPFLIAASFVAEDGDRREHGPEAEFFNREN
jgi:hypothetical protein